MANQYINRLNGSQNNGAKRNHEGNEQYGIYVNIDIATIIISSVDIAGYSAIHRLTLDGKVSLVVSGANTHRSPSTAFPW